MGSTESWTRLATTALLGTERGAALPPVEGAVESFVNMMDAAAVEERLLLTAATLDLYQRAGATAPAETLETPPAPEETRPWVSRAAGVQLMLILEGSHEKVLPEWLEACQKAGKVVRPRALPALLSEAVRKPHLRPAIQAVAGVRGRWLVEQNREWKPALEAPGEETWETGDRETRRRYLSLLRQRDPAAAVALLVKTWRQEPLEERTAFVEALEVGLSPADESFLEAALDDKRKEVREAAAELLSRLTESAFAQRMRERAASLITLQKGKGKGFIRLLMGEQVKLTVRLPGEELTPEMQRDGISAKSRCRGLGDKAWQLVQVVAGTPLSFWPLPPETLLTLAEKDDFYQALLLGWSTAAARQRAAAWVPVLLTRLLTLENAAFDVMEQLKRLLKNLAPADWENCLLQVIDKEAAAKKCRRPGELMTPFLLERLEHPWSPRFCKALIAYVAGLKEKQLASWIYAASGVLTEVMALRFDPALREELAKVFPSGAPLARVIDEMISTLQFRADMLKELES